jgi:hypothetical protein
MRTPTSLALVALVTLAAACGGGGRKPLQYGAATAPSADEQLAAGDAQTTLQGSLAFAPASEPTTGAPGLADALVGSLGGSPAPTAALPAPAGAQARRAFVRAAALPASGVALDPACVATTATSVVWAGCVATISEVDPTTGDSTDATVHVDGQLGWVAATGVTSWSIHESIHMVMVSGGTPMQMDAVIVLQGSLTTTATTMKGQTSSSVGATVSAMGLTMSEAETTTLVADLDYQADPFCVTGGTLTLEQVWTRRPAGATAADLPDQGWRFEWSGCGLFTVAHGG